jgi:hypothetical protein
MPRRARWTLSSPDLAASRGTGRTKPRTISARCSLLMTTPTPSDNTVYPSTVCICASICMMCCCPASRAHFSVTYAHVAVHPQEQVGRLTSRLPNFSAQTVMLWVTLIILVLPSNGNLTLNYYWSARHIYSVEHRSPEPVIVLRHHYEIGTRILNAQGRPVVRRWPVSSFTVGAGRQMLVRANATANNLPS